MRQCIVLGGVRQIIIWKAEAMSTVKSIYIGNGDKIVRVK